MEQRRRAKGPTLISESVLRPLGALARGLGDLLGELLVAALACLLLIAILWGWHDARVLTVVLLAIAAASICAGALVLLHERRQGRPSRRPLWASVAVTCLLGFALWASYVVSGCWVCAG